MSITDKLKWIVLPALLVIGLGVVEVTYPNALSNFVGFHTGYGRSKAGYFIVLFVALFLALTWNKIGGSVLILLGISSIVLCLRPQHEQIETQPSPNLVSEDKNNSLKNKLAGSAFRTGKAYVQRKLQSR